MGGRGSAASNRTSSSLSSGGGTSFSSQWEGSTRPPSGSYRVVKETIQAQEHGRYHRVQDVFHSDRAAVPIGHVSEEANGSFRWTHVTSGMSQPATSVATATRALKAYDVKFFDIFHSTAPTRGHIPPPGQRGRNGGRTQA